MEVRLIHKSSVLIVDRSAESREVLKTALERRGMRIFEAAGADDGLKLARQHRLDLIVLDLEAAGAADAVSDDPASDETISINTAAIRPTFADDFAAAGRSSAARTPMVLLGVARRRASLPAEQASQFVAKPYHYGPLILKIEQMLRKGLGARD
jgi:CheY-like chemotaxis protein